MLVAAPAKKMHLNFGTTSQGDIPQGRNGKHKAVVTKLLSDLDQLPKGVALKIPMNELAGGMENVRSALNRATRNGDRNVATATDAAFLYVWNKS
jgi:hypothetical protein